MARKARKTNDRKQKTRTSATAGKTTSESSAKNNPTAAKAQAMPASNPKKKAARPPGRSPRSIGLEENRSPSTPTTSFSANRKNKAIPHSPWRPANPR